MSKTATLQLFCLVGGAASLSSPSARSAECGPVVFHQEDGAVASGPKSSFRWREVKGASRYRVSLVARIPEGRILEDIRTETRTAFFQLPRPLDQRLVLVSISVTPVCPGAPGVTSAATMLVERTEDCAVPDSVDAKRSDRSVEMRWNTTGSESEVWRYSAIDGRLISSLRTSSKSFEAPVDRGDVQIVAIRSRCARAASEGVFVIY
jgi:hypothetical protein